MKAIFGLAALIVLAVGGYLMYKQNMDATDSRVAPAVSYTVSDFSWRIENAPDHSEDMPKQIVYLDVKGKAYKAGESMGCRLGAAMVDKNPNEVTSQSCWFAGGGDDYSVVVENNTYILKHRWTQESGGPEVNAEPVGPWETVVTIK